MVFDEHHLGRAVADGFDADGAGPRKSVHKSRTGDAIGKDIEQSFAETIAGRTKSEALEAF